MDTASEWLLTAPWEPIAVRRGDPLGFRNLSNRFAQLLAPDLSNRTHDARWLTILCWCLCVSEHAPWQSGAELNDLRWVRTRKGAAQRYTWIRPLELMWVARTRSLLEGNTSGRQLPGIRAVKRWFDSRQMDNHFGLSEDQWDRYRQTGVYGAYRVMLRRIPGFTKGGDGWSPDKQAHRLAELLVRHLGRKEQLPDLAPQKRISGKAMPETYWKNVWTMWDRTDSTGATQCLPEDRRDIRMLGDSEEAGILADLIFSNTSRGERRREVVLAAANSGAIKHEDLCEDIAAALDDHTNQEGLSLLVPFTRFADAALDSLVSVWQCFFQQASQEPTILLKQVAATPGIAELLERAQVEAKQWLDARRVADASFLPLNEVDALADQLVGTQHGSVMKQIAVLVDHHVVSGGGLRWMKTQDDRIVPTAPTRYQDATPYRFRLWQLCRLAVQCGVIQRMPQGLTDQREVPEADQEELTR